MRIFWSYVLVVLIWSTTPLAIKWSGDGPGFLFGAMSRMVIGAACIFVVLVCRRQGLVWHRPARRLYLAVGVQIYGAMTAVYWGAQFIPSGWISVIFGLTPLITALLTMIVLKGHRVTFNQIISYVLGLSGLAVMFGSAVQLGREAVLGIAAIIMASFLQSLSSVWIKAVDIRIPALNQVAGGLLVAVPAYLLTWALSDGHWPEQLSRITIYSIVYLGVIATTIGFALYYYLLTHLAATKVALITLISPVMALMIGKTINHEPLTMKVVAGSSLIFSALLLHEYYDRIMRISLRRSR